MTTATKERTKVSIETANKPAETPASAGGIVAALGILLGGAFLMSTINSENEHETKEFNFDADSEYYDIIGQSNSIYKAAIGKGIRCLRGVPNYGVCVNIFELASDTEEDIIDAEIAIIIDTVLGSKTINIPIEIDLSEETVNLQSDVGEYGWGHLYDTENIKRIAIEILEKETNGFINKIHTEDMLNLIANSIITLYEFSIDELDRFDSEDYDDYDDDGDIDPF